MKYLKVFENFDQTLVDKLIEDTRSTGEKHGVKIIFENTLTVPYAIGGTPVSGYFVDYGNPTLAVAIGKPQKEWVMILAHESSHMDQWIEKSPYWINSFIDGKEAVDYMDEWINGKEFTNEELNNIIEGAIGVELDCEKRAIEKAKKYNLPINIKEEIQKANSYILSYTLVKEIRKWNIPGKASHQVKEVWSHLPDTFDMDYHFIPDDLKRLYLKYCF